MLTTGRGGQHNSIIGPPHSITSQLTPRHIAILFSFRRMQSIPTEPTASSGIPYVGRPPLQCHKMLFSSAVIRGNIHATGTLPDFWARGRPTATNMKPARAAVQSLAILNAFCRSYSHCDMNHTVIASHDITSFDIINTCFVCKLKQTCSCTKKNTAGRRSMLKFWSTTTTNRAGSCRCERVNYGVGMAQLERQMGSKGRYSVTKW